MKKTLIVLLVLALLLPLSLSAFDKPGSQWNLHIGSSIYVSQMGVSRDVGEWEFGLNLDSGFPNLVIYSMLQEPGDGISRGEQFWQALKGSLTLAYAGDIYAKFDVVRSSAIDLDLSAGIAGLYVNLEPLGTIAGGFAELGLRLGWNFNEHNGIYLETNVPLYALIATKDKSTGETTLNHVFLFKGDDGIGTLLMITGLFCTRIGYRYSF